MDITPTPYKLQSVASGNVFEDTGWMLEAPDEKQPTLIRTVYDKKQIDIKDESYGIYRFADWLPIHRALEGSCAPVTYKSEGFAKHLGLHNLYITFSGYFPERGAYMSTCSFKETEAYSVCGRLQSDVHGVLVVASAGNTARAFAKVCSDNRIPLLLCVPEDNLDALWFERALHTCVKLVCTEKGSDYFDAINLSNIAAEIDGFIAEGGAKNVARRDGMSTTMLSAAHFIGQIPDFYFQAVGSGTGAIAAWEANLRLIEDGRFGIKKAKLMVSQNIPFTPMADAWNARSRQMLPYDEHQAHMDVEKIKAKVLSNRKPPYPVIGGLFDALSDTNGEFFCVSNDEIKQAQDLFLQYEGIDIYSASDVAVHSLMQAVEQKKVNARDIIMLNITGGGEQRFKQGKELWYLKPDLVFNTKVPKEEIIQHIKKLF
mgnify:CR=1 FL=1